MSKSCKTRVVYCNCIQFHNNCLQVLFFRLTLLDWKRRTLNWSCPKPPWAETKPSTPLKRPITTSSTPSWSWQCEWILLIKLFYRFINLFVRLFPFVISFASKYIKENGSAAGPFPRVHVGIRKQHSNWQIGLGKLDPAPRANVPLLLVLAKKDGLAEHLFGPRFIFKRARSVQRSRSVSQNGQNGTTAQDDVLRSETGRYRK